MSITALKSTTTRWSNVFRLTTGKRHIYLDRGFDNCLVELMRQTLHIYLHFRRVQVTRWNLIKMYVKTFAVWSRHQSITSIKSVNIMSIDKKGQWYKGNFKHYLRRGNKTNSKQCIIRLRDIKIYPNTYTYRDKNNQKWFPLYQNYKSTVV